MICSLTVLDDPTSADDRHDDPVGVVPRHLLELTVADGHDVGGRRACGLDVADRAGSA